MSGADEAWSPIPRPSLADKRSQRPHFRLTVRRLMIFVGVAACLLFLGLLLAVAPHDDPYLVSGVVRRDWALGPAPTITVDVFEGDIRVLPSADDRISVEIRSSVATKISQEAADEAFRSIETHLAETTDSVRITVRGDITSRILARASITLNVPAGVHLDLRTAGGRIVVGRSFEDCPTVVHQPVVARSIRARNDSTYSMHLYEGNLIVEASALRELGKPLTPTRLELTAPGQIEIIADLATVDATAWHGKAPKTWHPSSAYEDGMEGSILFRGTLAPGNHWIRAAHGIEFKLAGSPAVRVEAEATKGTIAGNLVPAGVVSSGGRWSWKGTIGSDGAANLKLRTDDGSIRLDRLD